MDRSPPLAMSLLPKHSDAVSYTVFARKYRPQIFEDVVGQEHITRTLRNAIVQNRLAHAYLFVGPRGTGKTSTARILAKALNCQSSPTPTVTPCGNCDSCKEITSGNSLDVLEFDAASNTQVEKIRDIIIDNVKFAPARGRYKVYLVDEVHMLSASSFNALLKTLEEPPAHVKFLFATTDVEKLPATILSRCQRFDLKRIGAPVIAKHLLSIASAEKVELTPEAASAIAVGADGGMRDAESMLDQLVAFCGGRIGEEEVLSVFGFTSRKKVSELCAAILAEDAPAAMRLVHEHAEAGRDLTQLLSNLIQHTRNLLIAQADPDGLVSEMGEEEVQLLCSQGAAIQRERLLELIDLFASSEQKMKWAANKQMYVEVALLRAIQTISQVTLTEVIDALGALREGRPLESVPPKKTLPAPTPAPTRAKPTASKPTTSPAKAAPAAAPATPAESQAPAATATTPDCAPATVSVAPPPAPAATPQPTTPPAPAPGTVSAEDLWPNLVHKVRQVRPLISMWLESGVLVEANERVAKMGFPPDQALCSEAILQPNNRTFLEGLLLELSGFPLKLESIVAADVQLRPIAQPKPPPPAPPKDAMSEFKDDPLIRRALEIFKGRIEAV